MPQTFYKLNSGSAISKEELSRNINIGDQIIECDGETEKVIGIITAKFILRASFDFIKHCIEEVLGQKNKKTDDILKPYALAINSDLGRKRYLSKPYKILRKELNHINQSAANILYSSLDDLNLSISTKDMIDIRVRHVAEHMINAACLAGNGFKYNKHGTLAAELPSGRKEAIRQADYIIEGLKTGKWLFEL